jgi:NAD(P)H-dependent FMN reductase
MNAGPDILGVVGSARRWGNSELMVRQVLRGAQREGARGQLLRLTSLQLESCTGCMRCAIGSRPCPLTDDMAWLVDTFRAADGLVLAVPTYFLGPAAVLKLVLDRLLTVTGDVDRPLPAARPAVTVAVSGLPDWRGVTLPYLNALAAAFGYQPIESLTAVAPGPGEVLLDDALMDEALAAGRRLGRGELEPSAAPDQVCPVCHCDSFMLQGTRATCPICGREATLETSAHGVRLRFDADSGGHHRWTPEALRTHMVDWVQATGPRYMARRGEIKQRRTAYRSIEIDWLCAPRREAEEDVA